MEQQLTAAVQCSFQHTGSDPLGVQGSTASQKFVTRGHNFAPSTGYLTARKVLRFRELLKWIAMRLCPTFPL